MEQKSKISEYKGSPIFAIGEEVTEFHVFRGNESYTITLPEKKVPAPETKKA